MIFLLMFVKLLGCLRKNVHLCKKNKNKTNNMEKETDEAKTAALVPVQQETPVLPEDPKDDDMGLLYIEKDFVYDFMSLPSNSGNEYRVVEYLRMWAVHNHVLFEFDAHGNVYLTKGELAEGEYYPCVTSHMDTVQQKHTEYLQAGVRLPLKTERVQGQHKVSIDGMGIGADDKGGVCISLSMFKYFDKLKACFFREEETGCVGSKEMDVEWFNNVGYVIGYDSPDLYRAAYACSGVKLFSYDFYEKYMKPVCDQWGLVKGCFFSEPYTDVKVIREKTHIICMNFGNGGYNAHAYNEYIVMEDMDHALGMGIDLIKHIGLTRHTLEDLSSTGGGKVTYFRRTDGLYGKKEINDNKLLSTLSGGNDKGHGGTNTVTYKTVSKKEDELGFESVEYIVNRYEAYINNMKSDMIDGLKKVCEEKQIDANIFDEVIDKVFNNEITF